MGSSIVFMTHFTDQETGIGSKYTPLGLNVSSGSFLTFQKYIDPSKYIWGHVQTQIQKKISKIKLMIRRTVRHTNGQKFNKDTFWDRTIMVIL